MSVHRATRRRRGRALVAGALAAFAVQPATAQDVPDEPDIVVTGRTPPQPGAVVGDIKPEIQLSPADIRSYGVSSVADLLNELAPQTRSDRGTGGAPLVLLNGHRISGFSEVRDLPTEAILRVDILPEEVALKYGAAADQRVVNFVLRPRFRATTAEATGGTATEGGAANVAGSADYLRIQRNGRLNLDLKATHVDALTEADRGVLDPARPGVAGEMPDIPAFRTLTRDADTEQLNAVYNHLLPGNLSATANLRVEFDQSQGENGIGLVSLTVPPGAYGPPAGPGTVTRYATGLGPLLADTQSSTIHLGTTLNRDGKDWRWSLVTNYDRTDTRTRNDVGADATAFQALVAAGGDPLAPFGSTLVPRTPDTARSLAQSGGIDGLVSGSPLSLPAGDVDVSLKLAGSFSGFDGESLRRGVVQATHFTRNLASGQLNLDVPLTSRKQGFGGAIGDLSANGNFAAQYLSDFGTLTTVGYGLHWTPRKPLSLVASHTDDHAAPSAQQLQGPVITTPNVAVFDPQTGTTAFATLTQGGNPALLASARHVTKVELNWKPLAKPDLTVTANYVETRLENAIAAFPATSAAIEAAFPDRFSRDANGDLVGIDTRPVNFAREASQTLRYGFNLAIPLKSTQVNPFTGLRRPGGDGPRDGDGRGGGERRGGGGFGGGGFGGANGGRLQFAVYHSIYFEDQVLIRPGVPVLDLLDGGALGSSGGQPRHTVDVQAGYSRNGLGARLSANWRSGTRVDASAADPNGALTFSPLATANLRLFANLGQMPGVVKDHPWLRGTRLTLAVTNLADARERVRDATGATPLAYQPGYLDPVGRAVTISFRKLFFTPPARRGAP